MITVKLTYPNSIKSFFINLKKDITITISLVNFFFEDEIGTGSFTNTITLPARGANAIKFQNYHSENDANLFQLDNNETVARAEIFNRTIKIDEGRPLIQDLNDSEMGLTIISGIKGLEFVTKKLKNLVGDYFIPNLIPEIVQSPEELIDLAKTRNLFSYPTVKFVFPMIKNSAFYNDTNADYEGYLNRWDPVNQKFFVNPNDYLMQTWNNFDSLSPQFFLMAILKGVFEYHNINLDGDFYNDPEQQQLLMENNGCLDLFLDLTSIWLSNSTNVNLGPGGGRVKLTHENYDHYGNHDHPNGETEIIKAGLYVIDAQLGFIVDPFVTYTIEVKLDGLTIASRVVDNMDVNTYGIKYDFRAYEGDIGKKLTIEFSNSDGSNLVLINGDAIFIHMEKKGEGFNRYDLNIVPANFMPDMTMSELLQRLQKTVGLQYDFDKNSQTLFMNYIKEGLTAVPEQDLTKSAEKFYSKKNNGSELKLLKFEWPSDDELSEEIVTELDTTAFVGTYNSYGDFPAPVQSALLVLARNEQRLYKSFYDAGSLTYKWDVYKYYYPNIILSGLEEDEEYAAPGTPVLSVNDTEHGWNAIIIPYILEPGYSPNAGVGDTISSSLRLMYWKGMQPNTIGQLYPMASSLKYNILGTDVGGYDIKWDGPTGLKENFWGNWFETLNVGIVWTRTFTLNIIQFLKFNVNRSFRCGNNNFIPKSANHTLKSSSKIIESEIEYIQIIS